jgi:hypothetical protein
MLVSLKVHYRHVTCFSAYYAVGSISHCNRLLLLLQVTFVRCKLQYASITRISVRPTDANKLEPIQWKFAFSYNSFFSPSKPIIDSYATAVQYLKLHTLSDRLHHLHTSLFVYLLSSYFGHDRPKSSYSDSLTILRSMSARPANIVLHLDSHRLLISAEMSIHSGAQTSLLITYVTYSILCNKTLLSEV